MACFLDPFRMWWRWLRALCCAQRAIAGTGGTCVCYAQLLHMQFDDSESTPSSSSTACAAQGAGPTVPHPARPRPPPRRAPAAAAAAGPTQRQTTRRLSGPACRYPAASQQRWQVRDRLHAGLLLQRWICLRILCPPAYIRVLLSIAVFALCCAATSTVLITLRGALLSSSAFYCLASVGRLCSDAGPAWPAGRAARLGRADTGRGLSCRPLKPTTLNENAASDSR